MFLLDLSRLADSLAFFVVFFLFVCLFVSLLLGFYGGEGVLTLPTIFQLFGSLLKIHS